jgi:predicted transcriptional regulator
MAPDDLAELGDLERDVMALVWRHGPLAAEAVRARLGRPLKESTIRTVLRRLEAKRYVTHATAGRTYLFQAAEPRGHAAARAVRRIIDWMCDGSVDDVLVGMVDSEMLSRAQLEALMARIDNAKQAAAKGENA